VSLAFCGPERGGPLAFGGPGEGGPLAFPGPDKGGPLAFSDPDGGGGLHVDPHSPFGAWCPCSNTYLQYCVRTVE
jgi:hypothetical protein